MGKYLYIDKLTPEQFKDFDGSEVVVSNDFVMFWKPLCPFDQWTPSIFTINGIQYNCAEQYMMVEKARLFGDTNIEKQIMNTDDPRTQQKLGKKVLNFNNEVWIKARYNIVFQGNLAKFTQNKDLRSELINTGNRTLVETSPIDKIWGIGLSANNPLAYDVASWNGLNLLGKVLEDVRKNIIT